MKKISVLGIDLKIYTMREILNKTENYLKNGTLNVVMYINSSLLVKAEGNPLLKDYIEKADITLPGDAELMKKCGITSWNAMHDLEERNFLREMLSRSSHRDYPMVILAEDEEELQKLHDDVIKMRSDIQVTAEYLLPEEEEEIITLINQINDITPKIIIIKGDYELIYKLIGEQQIQFINAEVAIIMPKDMNISGKAEGFIKRMRHKLYRKMFIRKANRYDNENK
ncbi:MAG: hypothetical protein K6B41_14715 [Butyrivibrio sp.]|nr:hypothetical protein [Butyrivibrio sp.]